MSIGENQVQPLGDAAQRFDLSGRVIVVTGASKGIGRELTILLAETGAIVAPTVRADADAVSLVAEARSRGLMVHPQQLDVRDVASINEAVSRILAAHGRIDVLVNNAGLGFARAAFDVTEADWDEMMAVNLRGAFFMSQAVARAMAASGRGGRIVNISSQGGLVGLPDAAVYCTSKGGLNMMTKTLAARVGEGRNHGQRRRADFHLYAGDGADPRRAQDAGRGLRQDSARAVRADQRCGRRDHLSRLGRGPDGHRNGPGCRRRMDFAMTETMRLTAEGCAATFNPADGGRLTSFLVGDHELLVAQGRTCSTQAAS